MNTPLHTHVRQQFFNMTRFKKRTGPHFPLLGLCAVYFTNHRVSDPDWAVALHLTFTCKWYKLLWLRESSLNYQYQLKPFLSLLALQCLLGALTTVECHSTRFVQTSWNLKQYSSRSRDVSIRLKHKQRAALCFKAKFVQYLVLLGTQMLPAFDVGI